MKLTDYGWSVRSLQSNSYRRITFTKSSLEKIKKTSPGEKSLAFYYNGSFFAYHGVNQILTKTYDEVLNDLKHKYPQHAFSKKQNG